MQSLRSIREQAGVSLIEISEATNIRVSLLEAIEEGRLDQLPGGLYTSSYIRQYARMIGLDEDEALRTCLPPPPPSPEPEVPARLGSGIHPIAWMQRFSSFLQ